MMLPSSPPQIHRTTTQGGQQFIRSSSSGSRPSDPVARLLLSK